MSHDPKFNKKISPLIKGQLPDFLQDADFETYRNFVRDFYKFLESARMKFTYTTNYLVLEPVTKSYVLEETDDNRVVLEDSVEFTIGETIVGQTSGAEATVLVNDARNSQIYITSNQRFELGEIVKGNTSGSEATLDAYKTNPVQNIQQMLDYANIDNTIFEYFDQFREAFLSVIPKTLATGVAKRKLVKNIKDLYSAKGTRDGHKLFFRILLGENAEIFYPNENILNVSGGDWKGKLKIRCTSSGASSNEAVGQVITGRSSGATASVDAASVFQQDTASVVEFDIENVVGTFTSGETLDLTSAVTDTPITFVIKSIVTKANIVNDGILHTAKEALTVDNTKGNGFADVLVNNIKRGSVSDVFVQTVGSGYEVGDKLTFTGGDGITRATGIVSAVGGGIALEDSSGNLIIDSGTESTEEPFNIALESQDVVDGPFYLYGTAEYDQKGAGKTGYFYPLFLTQSGAGGEDNSHAHTFIDFPGVTFYMPNSQANHGTADFPTGSYDSNPYVEYPLPENDLLILDGTDLSSSDAGDNILTNETQVSLDTFSTPNDILVLEHDTFATDAEASSIRDVFLSNGGEGYDALPTITVQSSNGSGAKILALTTDIGAVESLVINDSGINYNQDDKPDVELIAHFILKDVSGTFEADNTLTTHVGTVKSFDSDRQQLNTTFENKIKFDLEQSTAVNIPFVQEGNSSAVNENNLLAEDTQIEVTDDDDNIILNGTSVTTEATQFINVDVKHFDVASPNAQDYFIVDNVRQKQLRLKKGNTYYFDLSDSSLFNADTSLNRPFRFSTTEDGTHNSGTEYTTGVTKSVSTTAIGTTGAFIQIVVANDAPQLFYYNPNNSGEGGKVEVVSRNTIIADAGSNVLLDGTSVNKDRLLIETPAGENPLLGIDMEDNSGDILLESTFLGVIGDENGKVVLDSLHNIGTRFLAAESSLDDRRLKNEQVGNLILAETGGRLVGETQDSTSIGDHIVLDGTDASQNNAGQNLINQEDIDFSGQDVVITDSSGATGTILLADIATATADVDVTQDTEGNYINVKSLVGEDLIRVQDSYYYQQFSYEVQVGQSTATFINELKKAVHPAGFAPFGKVSIASFISAAIGTTGSQQADPVDSTETFSPILASTFDFIFDEVLQRRHHVPRVGARIGNRTDKITIDGSSTSTLALDGSDSSSSNAGSTIIAEDDLGNVNMIAESALSQDANGSIKCEEGTLTIYGQGNRIFAETASVQGGDHELVFVPNINVVVQSQARAR